MFYKYEVRTNIIIEEDSQSEADPKFEKRLEGLIDSKKSVWELFNIEITPIKAK